jgi:hypothetical protein
MFDVAIRVSVELRNWIRREFGAELTLTGIMGAANLKGLSLLTLLSYTCHLKIAGYRPHRSVTGDRDLTRCCPVDQALCRRDLRSIHQPTIKINYRKPSNISSLTASHIEDRV